MDIFKSTENFNQTSVSCSETIHPKIVVGQSEKIMEDHWILIIKSSQMTYVPDIIVEQENLQLKILEDYV